MAKNYDEQGKMETQNEGATTNSRFVSPYFVAPINMLKEELTGIYGKELLDDINDIIKLYGIYEDGADFNTEGAKDYVPSKMRHKMAKTLIDKEARFMFGRTPSFYVKTKKRKDGEATQAFLNEVLKKNMFGRKILQGGKDCFIGKRVALFINFDKRITVSFAPSLEFVFEVDENDTDRLTKIVRYYTVHDSFDKQQQRIYKKKYWMENDVCKIEEGVYNGVGTVIETKPVITTKLNFIPAFVIANDGLTGDNFGESEISVLKENESYYSKLSNADIDSLRKGMNQIKWVRDMDPKSTENLSSAPGAVWDLSSDDATMEANKSGDVGVLDNPMEYSTALEITLARIKSSMFEMLDIPETNAEALKGVVSSGKTLKAIYWGLMTRCDEKMLVWKPALEWMCETILLGAGLYPDCRKLYNEQGKLSQNFEIEIETNYPILEDELEEKDSDLAEVTANTMSKKAFMQKWHELTDDEVDEELAQMAKEREILEDSYTGTEPGEQNADGADAGAGDGPIPPAGGATEDEGDEGNPEEGGEPDEEGLEGDGE